MRLASRGSEETAAFAGAAFATARAARLSTNIEALATSEAERKKKRREARDGSEEPELGTTISSRIDQSLKITQQSK
jgi:hypothetical protein